MLEETESGIADLSRALGLPLLSIPGCLVRHGADRARIMTTGAVMNTDERMITGIATIGIPVTDQDRAVRFYTETLGLTKQMDAPLPQFGGRWITVTPADSATTIALVPASERIPAGVETGIRLSTPDAAAVHRRLREQGVDVGDLLHWQGVPPMFAFRDPDGNGLEVTQEWGEQ